jgi:hypothetical protein
MRRYKVTRVPWGSVKFHHSTGARGRAALAGILQRVGTGRVLNMMTQRSWAAPFAAEFRMSR